MWINFFSQPTFNSISLGGIWSPTGVCQGRTKQQDRPMSLLLILAGKLQESMGEGEMSKFHIGRSASFSSSCATACHGKALPVPSTVILPLNWATAKLEERLPGLLSLAGCHPEIVQPWNSQELIKRDHSMKAAWLNTEAQLCIASLWSARVNPSLPLIGWNIWVHRGKGGEWKAHLSWFIRSFYPRLSLVTSYRLVVMSSFFFRPHQRGDSTTLYLVIDSGFPLQSYRVFLFYFPVSSNINCLFQTVHWSTNALFCSLDGYQKNLG